MASTEWREDTKHSIDIYSELVKRYGVDPRALDWGSRTSQEVRFDVLTQIGSLDGATVLDVGCGLADLFGYLKRKGISVDYTGFDLVPEMIEHAHQRFPHAHLEVRDLMDETELSARFDFVIASGIFTFRTVNPTGYLEAIVRRMFALCRLGVAFNTQSVKASQHDLGQFYADPAQVLTMCLEITPRAVIRHDYLEHDFAVYLYKE